MEVLFFLSGRSNFKYWDIGGMGNWGVGEKTKKFFLHILLDTEW
jgi:hypothetical protein